MASEFLKSIGKVDVERYLGRAPKQQGSAGGLTPFGALGQGGEPPMGPGMNMEGGGAGGF
jgi:hypothetical protein